MSAQPEPPAETAVVRERVLARLREDSDFVLATHEHPDGDALGSLVAMQGLLTSLGKRSEMFMATSDLPLPREYRMFPLDGLISEPPADIATRTVVFLDCGNIDRNSASVLRDGANLINIDHHHDNTGFGTLNLVDPQASCTAEIVWCLMDGLGVTPSAAVAEALYIGLITDTGRFMYENTTPRAHRMAASLIEAGVDAPLVYRRLYEGMPTGKLTLLGTALAAMRRFDGGELTIATLSAEDFRGGEGRRQLLRGDHRPAARAGRDEGRRARARALDRRACRPAQNLAAGDRRRCRRLGDRPRPGRRRAPPRRGLHHADERSGAARLPALCDRSAAAPVR